MSATQTAEAKYPHDGLGKSDVELARLLGLREGYAAGLVDQREKDAQTAETAPCVCGKAADEHYPGSAQTDATHIATAIRTGGFYTPAQIDAAFEDGAVL